MSCGWFLTRQRRYTRRFAIAEDLRQEIGTPISSALRFRTFAEAGVVGRYRRYWRRRRRVIPDIRIVENSSLHHWMEADEQIFSCEDAPRSVRRLSPAASTPRARIHLISRRHRRSQFLAGQRSRSSNSCLACCQDRGFRHSVTHGLSSHAARGHRGVTRPTAVGAEAFQEVKPELSRDFPCRTTISTLLRGDQRSAE